MTGARTCLAQGGGVQMNVSGHFRCSLKNRVVSNPSITRSLFMGVLFQGKLKATQAVSARLAPLHGERLGCGVVLRNNEILIS
jgi:hypothetical protein